MRTFTCILAISFMLMAGCSSGEKKAAELLETARFEEKQNNFDHATQLYDEILSKYPSSIAAKEAGSRSADLKRMKKP